jgi:hypothetical protein
MSAFENKKKQTLFWKKHQTLLKICSELSSKCDAKILVEPPFYVVIRNSARRY